MRSSPAALHELLWPGERLGDAVDWLSRVHHLKPGSAPLRSGDLARHLPPGAAPEQVMAVHAAAVGIEVEPFSAAYRDLDRIFQSSAPAILSVPDMGGYLALAAGGGGRCTVLAPDDSMRRVPLRELSELLRAPAAAPYRGAVDAVLDQAGTAPEQQARAAEALLGTWLATLTLAAGWFLRPSPASSFSFLLRHSSLPGRLAGWLGAFLAQEAVYLAAWWVIGRSLVSGTLASWLLPVWVLLLLSVIPFQLLLGWQQVRFSQELGILFKQKLLYGALRTDPDEIRHLGSGQLLQRVLQIDAVEMLALGGGIAAVIALIQLITAGVILSQGQGGLMVSGMLALWTLGLGLAGLVTYRRARRSVTLSRSMTNRLVEKMIGHRTRLAQEEPSGRHAEEDLELVEYLGLARESAATQTLLNALPASWLLAGIATLAPSLAGGSQVSNAGTAVALGGILFAYQGFLSIQSGLMQAIQLLLAWDQVQPVFAASLRAEELPAVLAPAREGRQDRRPFLVLNGVRYTFPGRQRAAVREATLQIYPGDRLLLEGPSGGGKTTLAAILAGLRKPGSGLLFLHGYDHQSLGEKAWRERIVLAPQFHENHIFNDTFAFNLLLGRRWPPSQEDLQEAEAICAELGLAPLLERMPSGWQQMVGDNGWQLSHGERSRVYIARALLQAAELVIMDESFGALDPENLFRALECARRRAASLLVIAHP